MGLVLGQSWMVVLIFGDSHIYVCTKYTLTVCTNKPTRTQTTHRQSTRFAWLEALVLMKVVLRYSFLGSGALSVITIGVLLMQL